MTENTFALAFVGEAGLAALGAQVAVVNDSGSQSAHFDGAAVSNARAGLSVEASAHRNIQTDAIGVALGAIAAGAAVGIVSVSGDTTATIGNVALSGTVGGVTVSATDNLTADSLVISVNGGVGAGLSAALAFAAPSGTAAPTPGPHRPPRPAPFDPTPNRPPPPTPP